MIEMLLLSLGVIIGVTVPTSEPYPKEVDSSVLQLSTSIRNLDLGNKTGTGFATSTSNGKSVIVTNAHVCWGESHLYTKVSNEVKVHKVIKMSNVTDLCMLTGFEHDEVNPLKISDHEAYDEKVTAVGFPHSRFMSSSSGEIKVVDRNRVPWPWNQRLSKCELKPYLKRINLLIGPGKVKTMCIATMDMYFTTIQTAPGGSGSPIVNEDGEVVGVIAAVSTIGVPWAMAVTLPHLKSFLQD